MKIVYWGKGARGSSCLKAILETNHEVSFIITHPNERSNTYTTVAQIADQNGIPWIAPENPNSPETENKLRQLKADLFVLGGYGKIIKPNIIEIPKIMCINLHGGKLPKYRGSSPMNWTLINGEKSFSLSIIRVNAGVDTGDLLLERSFPVGINDTIRDLHAIANQQFPQMLIEILDSIQENSYTLKQQDSTLASYYPLRFPDDGLIFWDLFTAEQIHNRIRALTNPYPGAFTFFNGKKVKLIASKLRDNDYFGEPGRVYMKSNGRLLVCALDKCLWIEEAYFVDTKELLYKAINRYETMSTLRGEMIKHLLKTG